MVPAPSPLKCSDMALPQTHCAHAGSTRETLPGFRDLVAKQLLDIVKGGTIKSFSWSSAFICGHRCPLPLSCVLHNPNCNMQCFVMQERVGVLSCCSLGILLNIPASVLIPLPSLFRSSRLLFWTSTYVGLFVKALGKLLIINPATIMINQAAPPSQKGAVNGASSTLGALSRAAGPALGGGIWGVLADVKFPLHQFVPFVLMAFGALLARFAVSFIPSRSKH